MTQTQRSPRTAELEGAGAGVDLPEGRGSGGRAVPLALGALGAALATAGGALAALGEEAVVLADAAALAAAGGALVCK